MENTARFYFTMMSSFLTILLGYFSYEILKPFLSPLAWAIVLAILFYPVYAAILRYVKEKSFSAALTLVLILLILIVPVAYLSVLLAHEASALANLAEAGKMDTLKTIYRHPLVERIFSAGASALNIPKEELMGEATSQLTLVGKSVIAKIAKGMGSLFMGAVGFIVMAMTLFFMLRDAPDFLQKIRGYLPFSEEQKDKLLTRANDIVFSTMYGGIVVALIQGSAGGAAFALLGLSTPVFWGLIMVIAAFLPVIGAGVVWGPAAIYLIAHDELMRGVILIVTGMMIAGIDYFLRPVIIGNRTKMPFLVIFFSVIGGLRFFGLIGFILGPMVTALFIAVLDTFGTIGGGPRRRNA